MIKKIIKLGFTFIELLMAIMILSVLSLIVIPSVTERMNRTKVDTAAQTMLKDVQFLQKWAAITGGYSVSNKVADNGKCPFLPYQFESDTSPNHYYYIASSDSNLMGYIGDGTNKVKLPPSTCNANTFTLRAYPICKTPQSPLEKSGVICVDQDANVLKNATPSCSNIGSLNSMRICVDISSIESGENTIPDNNPTAPPRPTPSVDPYIEYCSTQAGTQDPACLCLKNPESAICTTVPYCQEHPSQPQCACVINPNGPNCMSSYCNLYPEDQKCKDACNPTTPASWCYDLCKDARTPPIDWCKNLPTPTSTPTPTATPTDTPTPGPTVIPDKYDYGSIAEDTCGNSYKCIAPNFCNNSDSSYQPSGSNKDQGWSLSQCKSQPQAKVYESGTTYASGTVVNTKGCVSYVCNAATGNSCNSSPDGFVATSESAMWIPCYNLCAITTGKLSYSNETYTYDAECNTQFKYQCGYKELCNDKTGIHEPGNENAGGIGDNAWRIVTGK